MLFCYCLKCNAQDAALNNADTALMNRLYYRAYNQTNPDSAAIFLKELLPLSISAKTDSLTNGILLKLGEYYISKGDCMQGLAYTKQGLQYAGMLSFCNQANDYGHLGWVYFGLGDYVSATENFYAALDCLRKSGCPLNDQYVVLYRMLGMINFRLHQNEKALYYFNLGEAIARKNDYKNHITISLLAKGAYYTDIHQPDSARKCFNEAIKIADKITRPELKAQAYEGLGKTFIESADFQKAVYYLQLAVDTSNNRDKTTAIDASYYLGEALYRLKKYKDAETILVPALKQATTAQLKDNVIKGYSTLTDVYKATGQYTKALDCMDSIIVLKNSLENTEKTKAINLMEVKYQTAQKDKQIANNQLLIARQNSKIAHKNIWMLIIGGSVLLFLLISAGVYTHYIHKQRSLEKENKIGILQAAIRGGDNERSRIARELHDGIGGMLGAAMMRFSSIRHDNAVIANTPGYIEAMSMLREMGDEIRKTAHNLMPDVLLKQSLPDAIRAYCNSVHKNDALQIDFQCYGSFDEIAQEHKLNLYRIVQELVKNVIQHAGATCAIIQLLQNENLIIISVEDNGAGFNKNQVKTGQGLFNTQTRAHSLDGKFTLESIPGKGTSVFVEIMTGAQKVAHPSPV